MNKHFNFLKIIDFEIVVFCLFIVTTFLAFRHITNFADASRAGWFSELLAISIYTADFIFLLLLLAGKKHLLKHSNQNIMLIGAIFVFLFVEALRNPNISLGIYSLFRIIQFFVLVVMFSRLLREQTARLYVSVTLIGIGIFESTLGLFHVIAGHSLGLRFLGEQILSTGMAGVAKVDLTNGEKLLRAYGTMPHPNILGGFLVLSICASLYIFYQFPKKRLISGILTTFILVGLILTFSRSAYFAIFLLVAILFWQFRLWTRARTLQIVLSVLILFFCATAFISPFRTAILHRIAPPASDLFFSDRLILNGNGAKIFRSAPLFGVGLGSYFNSLIWLGPSGLSVKYWQYDYPHNTIIVVLAELGIFGLILIPYLYIILKPIQYSTNALVVTLLIISPLILLDHYLWTNQAGRVMLVLFITLLPQILTHPQGTK